MRRIQKHREPECLAAARRDLAAVRRELVAVRRELASAGREGAPTGSPSRDDWATLTAACKDAVRRALEAEQAGLCAYCMRRIDGTRGARDDDPQAGGMRVEHWTPRSEDPSRTFEWSNLLGVCGGILEASGGSTEQTCDKVRGERELELHPAHPTVDVQALFRYTAEGEILSEDARARRDIETLNLQAGVLRARRREVWRSQGAKLRRDDSLGVLRRILRDARTPGVDGRLPPFAAVIEYYVTRKLRQRGAKT